MLNLPFKLEPETAIPLMIEAFNAGKLGAQTGKTLCHYRYEDGSCCILGAAMPDDVAKFMDSGTVTSLHSLVENKRIAIDGLELKERFNLLQAAHDRACTHVEKEVKYKRFVDTFKQFVKDFAPEQLANLKEGV